MSLRAILGGIGATLLIVTATLWLVYPMGCDTTCDRRWTILVIPGLPALGCLIAAIALARRE